MALPDRDEHGRFRKGYKGGPGRPRREVEEEYREAFLRVVSITDVEEVIVRALRDAKKGDNVARKFLFDYLIGPPVERKDITSGGKAIKGYVSISPDEWDETNTNGNI